MAKTSPKEFLPDWIKFLIAVYDKVLPSHVICTGVTLVGVGFLLILLGWIWKYNSSVPATAVTTKSSSQKHWKNSLEDLYARSFPNLLSTEQKIQLELKGSNDFNQAFEIRFRLYQDFDSHTDFASVFVPSFKDAQLADMTQEILTSLSDQIKPNRELLRSSVGVGLKAPGSAYTEGKDLVFSGRVFIFTQNNLTPIQVGELTKIYKEKKMFLEIRGNDYWLFHRDD